MDFVVDASIASSWFLVDEQNGDADLISERLATATGRVPALFWFEMQGVLLRAERRGRCDVGEADTFMQRLRTFRLSISPNRSDDVVLALARRHQLTAYDATYLDVALELSIPLATADKRLATAVLAERIPLLGPYAAPTP
jgi:predicted nucleic acid-binding protein